MKTNEITPKLCLIEIWDFQRWVSVKIVSSRSLLFKKS